MLLLLLFLIGLFASTVDAIAGGGGLISLPMLLSIGIPPHLALGTNKLQASIGTLSAVLKYYRHGYISLKESYIGLSFGALGAVSGAMSAQLLQNDLLAKIVPLLLCVIFIYTLLSPHLGFQDRKPKMKEVWFYLIFGFVLGYYDGFFGPGTGAFWTFSLTCLLGFNLIKATAYTKLFNLNSNLMAVLCFAIGGNIDYKLALAMALGSLLGGFLGAHFAISKGARIIRPIFLIVVSMTVAVLLYRTYTLQNLFANYLKNYLWMVCIGSIAIALSGLFIYKTNHKKSE